MKPSGIRALKAVRDAHATLDAFILSGGWILRGNIKAAAYEAMARIKDFKAEMEEDPSL